MTEADVHSLYVKYGYFLFRRCLTYVGDEATALRAFRCKADELAQQLEAEGYGDREARDAATYSC